MKFTSLYTQMVTYQLLYDSSNIVKYAEKVHETLYYLIRKLAEFGSLNP